jgi:Flp pilus assembly protein TadG
MTKNRTLRQFLSRFRRDASGLAAIEFGMIAGVLTIAALNATDVSIFLYDKLQVNNATQMGAQAAWAKCDLNHLPVTTRCPNMGAAVTAAVQSTSLGNAITIPTGYPSDGYYCVSTSGTLQRVSNYDAPPTNCSAAGDSSTTPAEYVQVQTSYAYSPLFSGLTVLSFLPTRITSASWVRLH